MCQQGPGALTDWLLWNGFRAACIGSALYWIGSLATAAAPYIAMAGLAAIAVVSVGLMARCLTGAESDALRDSEALPQIGPGVPQIGPGTQPLSHHLGLARDETHRLERRTR